MQVKSLISILALSLIMDSALALEQQGWQVSQAGTWSILPHGSYAQGAGSASKLLRVDEALPNHKASLLLRESITRKVTFSLTCLMQSPEPALELEVPALDIRMQDSFNGFVFARFCVDEGDEFSLRGELSPPGKIIFAPLTQGQNEALKALKEAMAQGETLKIALLQGSTAIPKVYEIPLAGLNEILGDLSAECQNIANVAGHGTVSFLPDYLTKESDKYAPLDYTLKPKEPAILPPEPVIVEEPPIEANPQDEAVTIPFTGDGSRASIDAQGNVIEAPATESTEPSNQDPASQELPQGADALSPMQIDENGMPIF